MPIIAYQRIFCQTLVAKHNPLSAFCTHSAGVIVYMDVFLIHQCDIEVEISCKEKPCKIRKLEIGGGFVDPVKLYYHNDNNGNEKEKPDKGEGISLKIEEYNAPEKVYDKIYAEDLNCV